MPNQLQKIKAKNHFIVWCFGFGLAFGLEALDLNPLFNGYILNRRDGIIQAQLLYLLF